MTIKPLAAAYYRCSTDEQDTSIRLQDQKVSAYFADQYQIVDKYMLDEGKSGSHATHKRTDFLRMIDDLTTGKWKGKVKVILCLDTSRFDRLDTIEGAEFKKRLRAEGVVLHSVMEGMIDWNTMTGRIVDSVLAEARHQFSLNLAEKSLQGKIATVTQRKKHDGRPIPYGFYKRATDGKQVVTVKRGERFETPKSWDCTLVPGDPQEVAAVEWLYESFLSQDIGYRQLGVMLDNTFPSPTGMGWQSQAVKDILRNPLYVGDTRIGDQPKGTFFRSKAGKELATRQWDKAEPVIVKDTHGGIIKRDQWDAAQAKIARKNKEKKAPHRHGAFPLSGILWCGNCGGKLVGEKTRHGKVVYRCPHASATPMKGCKCWTVKEPMLLPFILEKMVEEIKDFEAYIAKPPVHAKDELADLKRKAAALERKVQQGHDRLLDAPPALVKGMQDAVMRLQKELDSLKKKIRNAQPRNPIQDRLAWFKKLREETEQLGEIILPVKPGWLHAIDKPEERYKPGLMPHLDMGIRIWSRQVMATPRLREILKTLGTQCYLWFKKNQEKRWEIERMRFKMGGMGIECRTVDQHSQTWRSLPGGPPGNRRPLTSTSSLASSPRTMKSRFLTGRSPRKARRVSSTPTWHRRCHCR